MVDVLFGADYTAQLTHLAFGVYIIAAALVARVLVELGFIKGR